MTKKYAIGFILTIVVIILKSNLAIKSHWQAYLPTFLPTYLRKKERKKENKTWRSKVNNEYCSHRKERKGDCNPHHASPERIIFAFTSSSSS